MKKLEIPTTDDLEKILSDALAKDHEDEYVEMGENWELIAEIFYRAGYEKAEKK